MNDAVSSEKGASLQDQNPLIQIVGQACRHRPDREGNGRVRPGYCTVAHGGGTEQYCLCTSEQNVQLERASQHADAAIHALERRAT
jgi:hypothetical protein